MLRRSQIGYVNVRVIYTHFLTVNFLILYFLNNRLLRCGGNAERFQSCSPIFVYNANHIVNGDRSSKWLRCGDIMAGQSNGQAALMGTWSLLRLRGKSNNLFVSCRTA